MKMRKGFTLVELLIVIIIIGILAAAMLLSSSSATDSATATKIVSNLRSIKAAVLMYRSDNQGALPGADINNLKKYFGGTDFGTEYTITAADPASNTPSYVKYTGSATEMTTQVQAKLKDMAKKNTSILQADGQAYDSGPVVMMNAE